MVLGTRDSPPAEFTSVLTAHCFTKEVKQESDITQAIMGPGSTSGSDLFPLYRWGVAQMAGKHFSYKGIGLSEQSYSGGDLSQWTDFSF